MEKERKEEVREARGGGVLIFFQDIGLALTNWTERWIPDAWIVALILTVIVFLMTLAWGNVGPFGALIAWGKGLWTLLALMAQFSLTLVVAYACAVSPPLYRFLNWLGSRPNPNKPWQAITLMAIFSLVTGWINWAFTIVVSAIFAPYIARNNPKVDYRLLVATAYLGIGVMWHAGLSGSATLISATPDNFLIKAGILTSTVPTTATVFTTYNLILALMTFVLCTILASIMTPHPDKAFIAPPEKLASLIKFETPQKPKKDLTPSIHMDWWPGWNILVAAMIFIWLGWWFWTKGLGMWTIDIYNMVFLGLAVLFHWRPKPLLDACTEGVKNAWGILLQFPFYAGIFGLITFTQLGKFLTDFFVSISTSKTFLPIVYIYSGILNYFVPSGGAKWSIEATYLLKAGEKLGVSTPAVVLAYSWGDMMTDIIQPFWAIGLLAIVGLKFGQIMGYCTVIWLFYMAMVIIAMFFMPLNLGM